MLGNSHPANDQTKITFDRIESDFNASKSEFTTYALRNIGVRSDDDVWGISDRCDRAANIRVNYHRHQDWHRIELHHFTQSDCDWGHEQYGRYIV